MTQRKIDETLVSRRSFVACVAVVPMVVSSVVQVSGAIAPTVTSAGKSTQLAVVFNANMMQSWEWFFDLAPALDGTFTLFSKQVYEIPDDEPWLIDPRTGLRSGRDIYHALQAEIDLVDAGMSEDIVESAQKALAEIDPVLAEEFLAEAIEWGLWESD